MGMVSRFKDIMESNINAILDKAEDPEKMIDQTLRNLREDFAKVKKETAQVMAAEDEAKRKVDECNAYIERASRAAQNALRDGNEQAAKNCLKEKQQHESKLVALQATYDIAKKNAEQMRKMHDKLASDINDLENRKDVIKAKTATAKAQQRMNKIKAGANTASSISAFERMEAKADRLLDAANAEAELNEDSSTPGDDVARYSAGGTTSSVDAELEALKKQMGMA